ncbi:hypothetical protein JCGZ_01827 [Jatropha curcas]|uniref:Uncharacterized protein n=1 Tax=Jatropha curcas TaxID=180498 RepID=A0A067JRX6_JATCU|nr:aquaporin SIP1-1 [Jatropha curcas]KDP22725.1 hypothetical protein JCGZ_01827 [Jatropha curcas]
MGLIRVAMADAILTSLWVFSVPILRVLTTIIASTVGVEPKSLSGLFISINLSTSFMLIFILVGAALGGASYNPTTTVSLYAAGLKPSGSLSLKTMAVRFPAQAAGGVVGVKAILQAMPRTYRNLLKGPSLKVDLHTGGLAEGILSFGLCFSLLLVMVRGPKNLWVKIWLVKAATAGLVVIGGKYTGPCMNPANAYGWAYANNWHNSWDLFYVYWICPLIGATSAAWVFRFLFNPTINPKPKQA